MFIGEGSPSPLKFFKCELIKMERQKNEVENINRETVNIEEEKVVEIPKYIAIESNAGIGNIFDCTLEQLIYEKMYLMFEVQMPLDEKLFTAKCELQTAKDKLINETDFSKELGKSRTNQAEREAYMKPYLAEYEEKVNELTKKVKYYENKILIVNDLIRYKRTALKIEAELQ